MITDTKVDCLSFFLANNKSIFKFFLSLRLGTVRFGLKHTYLLFSNRNYYFEKFCFVAKVSFLWFVPKVANMSWFQRKAASAVFATPPTSTFDEALTYLEKTKELDPNMIRNNVTFIFCFFGTSFCLFYSRATFLTKFLNTTIGLPTMF